MLHRPALATPLALHMLALAASLLSPHSGLNGGRRAVVVAHAGDCRVVLGCTGRGPMDVVARSLNQEHKPDGCAARPPRPRAPLG